jgi:hypothetical protein
MSRSASSDSRNLPDAVEEQLIACAKQLPAEPLAVDPGKDAPLYEVEVDLNATEDGGHQEAIDGQQGGLDACLRLQEINCTSGHSMANL